MAKRLEKKEKSLDGTKRFRRGGGLKLVEHFLESVDQLVSGVAGQFFHHVGNVDPDGFRADMQIGALFLNSFLS